MTTKEIEKRMATELNKVRIIHETARTIRELLDNAAEQYGDDAADDDIESRILDLVTEDESS